MLTDGIQAACTFNTSHGSEDQTSWWGKKHNQTILFVLNKYTKKNPNPQTKQKERLTRAASAPQVLGTVPLQLVFSFVLRLLPPPGCIGLLVTAENTLYTLDYDGCYLQVV